MSSASQRRLRVVVVGGGIAGAEALLALHDLAGERVELTLVSSGADLVVPALSVAEAFSLGAAQRHPLSELVEQADAGLVVGSLAAVDGSRRQIRLQDGTLLDFDALLIATGARAVARVDHATTWWPWGDHEELSGLLRDLEEGYIKRVAFVIPPGAVWPLPLYEIALMAAREVAGMGIDDAELTVITPEAVPLTLFGADASAALREELAAVTIKLETATVARIERAHPLQAVLQPTARRLDVDRAVAIPAVEGPAISGTAQNSEGFILVDRRGQMQGSDTIWAAGDAIAYPIKFGGLATQQADVAAAAIAAMAGAAASSPISTPRLTGVLMTGSIPRPLGTARRGPSLAHHPLWKPAGKVLGRYLTGFLDRLEQPEVAPVTATAVTVDEALPSPGDAAQGFRALSRPS
jgi:sulfide:quinone oxidoreductase